MARVLVTGGTGDLGSKLVQRFAARGDAVRVLSRRPRSAEATTEWAQETWRRGPVPMRRWRAGILSCTRRRRRYAGKGGRWALAICLRRASGRERRTFYISIVGIERIPLGYYKAKLECERLIEASGVPFSILRAVQFHNLIDRPSTLLCAFASPRCRSRSGSSPSTRARSRSAWSITPRRVPPPARPRWAEVRTLGDLAAAWLRARRKRALILPLPLFGKVATGFRNGYNCTPDHAEGKLTWEQWLEGKYSRQRMGSE
jgi:hypothetical protein